MGASANNWGAGDSDPDFLCTEGDPNSECTADNTTHSVYFGSPFHADLKNAIENSMANDYDDLSFVSMFSTTDKEGADIRIRYYTQRPQAAIAYTTCENGAVYEYENIRYQMGCKQQVVFYQTYPDAVDCWDDGPCRRWLACQELGHTLGLQHTGRQTTCMSLTAGYAQVLDSHDEEHLDDCYPKPQIGPLPTSPAETRSDSCRLAGQ